MTGTDPALGDIRGAGPPDVRVVVIGVGNEFRGDDGAGPAVLRTIQDLLPPGVELLVSDGEPTQLLEAWTGACLAIVVDAVAGGQAAPGTLHRVVVDADELTPAAEATTPASTHGLGLGTAIDLARALGRMPARLIVHGVQASDFSQGVGLSATVAAAVDQLAAAVLADLREGSGQLRAGG